MNNKDLNTNERESDSISQLLGSLRRVEAPNDFDFRVRSRIAKGRPVDGKANWLPVAVRYAMPLVLLVLIGGYFGFNSFYQPEDANVPVIAEVKPTIAPRIIETVSQPEPEVPQNDIATLQPPVTKSADVTEKPLVKKPLRSLSVPGSKNERPGGGSYDAAIRPSINLTPLGQDQNSNVDELPQMTGKASRPTSTEFLRSIGIKANSAGPGGRILSVRGAAANAGARVGDVIESLNIEGRSLWIRRDGRSVEIVIN